MAFHKQILLRARIYLAFHKPKDSQKSRSQSKNILSAFRCHVQVYENVNTKTKRATTLGLGSRFKDLINTSDAPSPHLYQVGSLNF